MKTLISQILIFMLLLANDRVFAQCVTMVDQNFNHWNDRRYSIADAKSDFNNKIKPWTAFTYRGIAAPGASASLIGDVAQETRIVNGQLRAQYMKNDAGGYAGGFLFDPYFDGVEEAYLEYKIKFDKDFFWATGGKLPGLGGSTKGVNSETVGRGTIPSGTRYNEAGDGFSARLMWRRNRDQTTIPRFILYSYFAKKPDGSDRKDNQAGDDISIFTGLKDNVWYTVRQYIKLNTPGQANGTVIMWINGNEVYKKTNHTIRKAGRGDLKINALIMNTYRGGARTDPVWHSPRTEYAFFDDFKVWTGCVNPPSGGATNPEAPTVSITNPANNATFNLGDTIAITANASAADGSIEKVNFRVNSSFYSQARNAPYTSTFTPDQAGTYVLDANAFDDKGLSTFSQSITVTVLPKEEVPVEILTLPNAKAPVVFRVHNGYVLEWGTDAFYVELVNINGKVIKKFRSTDKSLFLSSNELKNGVNLLRINGIELVKIVNFEGQ